MNKKDLIDLGIAEDVAEKIVILHAKDIESHKTKLTEAESARDQFKTQLDAATQQINGFKGMKTQEEVDAAVNEWKTKAEKAEADATESLKAVKFDHAVESALAGAKAKNVKAVRALLSTDKLTLKDDGTIDGLEDQLKEIKTKNDYLFEGEKPAPRIVTGGNNKPVQIDPVVSAMRKGAGLPEPTEGN